MTTAHRDHTVCGICNASFYVCHKFRTKNGQVHNTNPGNKFQGTAYESGSIAQDEIKDNGQVHALVKKPPAQVTAMIHGYPLHEARDQDEEHFLTYRFPIARDHHGTSCLTSLAVGSRFGIRKIKMCGHEDGPCVEAFDPENPTHAVGVPFHLTCLEMFRSVSLYKNGSIVWAGLYELGIQKNHAGFRNITRDGASESNHHYNAVTRENTWMHAPGTEWVVVDPLVRAHYPIQLAYYIPTASDKDPREQVFSGDYRLAVGSVGSGAWNYWGPRIASWRNAMDFKAQTYLPGPKREANVVMKKKPRLSALPASVDGAGVVAGPSTIPANDHDVVTAPSNIFASTNSVPDPPIVGRDLFSLVPIEVRIPILHRIPFTELASLRLMSRRFAEIPMTHFRDRLARDMPWAWEVLQENGELVAPPAGMRIDYKEMYRLVRRTVGTGVGAIKAMRNRKRIWEYCERILELIAEAKEGG